MIILILALCKYFRLLSPAAGQSIRVPKSVIRTVQLTPEMARDGAVLDAPKINDYLKETNPLIQPRTGKNWISCFFEENYRDR